MVIRSQRGVRFPYEEYMQNEGIPLFEEVAGSGNVTQLPREPWARTGGNGTFIQLQGTFQSERGIYVQEIPGGQALNPERHIYEKEIFVLEGRGLTETWQNGGAKITFEWGAGSVFAIPKNVEHRLVNGSREPVIFMAVTNAPRVINAVDDLNTVFQLRCPHVRPVRRGP